MASQKAAVLRGNGARGRDAGRPHQGRNERRPHELTPNLEIRMHERLVAKASKPFGRAVLCHMERLDLDRLDHEPFEPFRTRHRAGQRLDLPLEPARLRPVADRAHLRRLVGYLAGQPRHHGAGTFDGTCLPDLLGARRMGFDAGPLATQLPRENLGALALQGAGFDVRAL
jgi:hypothetical protein